MTVSRNSSLRYSSVTPQSGYLSRRRFLAGVPLGLGFAAAGLRAETKLSVAKSPFSTTEPVTPIEVVTAYNNFFELAKPQVLDLDGIFRPPRWKSGSAAIAASKDGRSSSPGSAFP
jgi:hypothetical protein